MHPKIKFDLQEIIIQKILIFFIFLNFFFPKIPLFSIPGFSQGLRLENLICMILLIALIFGKRLTLTIKDFKHLKTYITIFIIILFSSYIGWVNGIELPLIFVVRTLEYLVFAFLIFKSNIKVETIKIFIKFFYLACFFGILLQYLDLMGVFSSTGITDINPEKYTAFTSGPWELAFMISISFFTLLIIDENNFKQIIIYFILTSLILFFSGSKTLIISFFCAVLVFFFFKTKTINLKIFFYIFMIILPIVTILILNEFKLKPLDQYEYLLHENPNDVIENIIKIDYNFIYQSIKEFLLYGNVRAIEDTAQQYTSFQYRLIHWNNARDNWLINQYTIIFGAGAQFIYYDSFVFRIIFTTGIIGTFYFIIIALKIPFFLSVFFLLSGLGIDFLASYKLTIFTIILHYVITERRNS